MPVAVAFKGIAHCCNCFNNATVSKISESSADSNSYAIHLCDNCGYQGGLFVVNDKWFLGMEKGAVNLYELDVFSAVNS